MITLKQISKTFTDCTALYRVELDKPYTVKEFIDEVLKRNEWGYIGIKQKGNKSIFGDPKCEYKSDKLISVLPDEYQNQIITEVNANGGYSNMDYLISIQNIWKLKK